MSNTNRDKEKRRAILELLGGKRFATIGGSVAITLPRMWIRLYAWDVDGVYWAKVIPTGDRIIIEPLNKEEARAMMEANNVAVA